MMSVIDLSCPMCCGIPDEMIEEYLVPGDEEETKASVVVEGEPRQWDFVRQPPVKQDDVREHPERENESSS